MPPLLFGFPWAIAELLAGALEVFRALSKTETENVVSTVASEECGTGDGGDACIGEEFAGLESGSLAWDGTGVGENVVGAGRSAGSEGGIGECGAKHVAFALIVGGELEVIFVGQGDEASCRAMLER